MAKFAILATFAMFYYVQIVWSGSPSYNEVTTEPPSRFSVESIPGLSSPDQSSTYIIIGTLESSTPSTTTTVRYSTPLQSSDIPSSSSVLITPEQLMTAPTTPRPPSSVSSLSMVQSSNIPSSSVTRKTTKEPSPSRVKSTIESTIETTQTSRSSTTISTTEKPSSTPIKSTIESTIETTRTTRPATTTARLTSTTESKGNDCVQCSDVFAGREEPSNCRCNRYQMQLRQVDNNKKGKDKLFGCCAGDASTPAGWSSRLQGNN